MRPTSIVLTLAGLVAAAGCSPRGAGGDASAPFDCGDLTVGLDVRGPDGTFAAVDRAPKAELVLGFQGFQMLFVQARMSRQPPVTSGAVVITVEGSPARSQPFAELAPADDGHGGLVAPPFPIFFNADTIADLDGLGCALTLRLGDARWTGIASGHVTLSYLPGCAQSPDGAIGCPDGGAR